MSSFRAVVFIESSSRSYSPMLGSSPIPTTITQSAYSAKVSLELAKTEVYWPGVYKSVSMHYSRASRQRRVRYGIAALSPLANRQP
jgi:hypothetical protein